MPQGRMLAQGGVVAERSKLTIVAHARGTAMHVGVTVGVPVVVLLDVLEGTVGSVKAHCPAGWGGGHGGDGDDGSSGG